MQVGARAALGVFLHEQLQDARFGEVVDGCVGSEDGNPGACRCVLGQDCGYNKRSGMSVSGFPVVLVRDIYFLKTLCFLRKNFMDGVIIAYHQAQHH